MTNNRDCTTCPMQPVTEGCCNAKLDTPPVTTDNVRLSSDRAAMVDKSYHWIKIDPDKPPPRSAKLQLIDRRLGAATYGKWEPGTNWTHYAPLPTFDPEETA